MTTYTEDIKTEDIYQEVLKQYVNYTVGYCNGLAKEAGWWSNPDGSPIEIDENIISKKLLLIHSEISEAVEGLRKDLMDDHLPNRKMFEVELADTLIRLLDLAGATGIDLGGAMVDKLIYNANREDHKLENRNKEGGKKF
jgi:NTP pyrophosphatase (non-canonical NTP hydrolase)